MMSSSDSSHEEIVVRRAKIFRQRIDYGHLETSYEFIERFTAHNMESILNFIGSRLQRSTKRSRALSAKLQLQVAIHWMRTGAQYHAIGDMHGISKASVCRAIHNVVSAVNNKMRPLFVKFPTNGQRTVARFFSVRGMPMVCGCLDGTLIKIDHPCQYEEAYVDRHCGHSIRYMVVGGPDGILLGDSAYPLKEWFIPPIMTNINDEANRRFLRANKFTRRLIDNAIGVLKEKFPCINYLQLEPKKACEVFNCVVTLFNFARFDEEFVLDEDSNYWNVSNETISLEEVRSDEQRTDRRGQTKPQTILNYFRNE